MFCSNCGKMIPEGASICPECGLNLAGAAQQAYNEMIPSAPAMPEIPLAEPIQMNNVLQQTEVVPQNQNAEEYSFRQNMDSDTGSYAYQQNMGQNAGSYVYPQNVDQNAGGYTYQQNVDQNAGGYVYSQNMDQNTGGYTYQQNVGDYAYQQNMSQNGGYYDGLNSASPEQGSGNAGLPGRPGSSGGGGALALGICSICIGILGGFTFGVIGAVIGIALGMVGLIMSINIRKANPGEATGGLVTSIIGLSFAVVMLIGCVACGAVSRSYLSLGCVGGSCGVANDLDNLDNITRGFR